MTLMEYLEDYASSETREAGIKMIEEEIEKVPNEKVKAIAKDNLKKITEGSRDFRF
jgi:2-iminoacetate synthase